MKKLSDYINIGTDTESKLIQAGIDSFEKLKAAGSHEAFLRLQESDPGACLSLLYGLEGALSGIKWNKLPPETKKSLQQFYRMVKKQ